MIYICDYQKIKSPILISIYIYIYIYITMVLKNLKVNLNTTSVRDIETCPTELIMKKNSLNMLIMKMIFCQGIPGF